MSVSPIPLRDAMLRHDDDLKTFEKLAISTRQNYRAAYSTLADHLASKVLGGVPMTTDLTLETLEDYFRNHIAKKAPKTYDLRRSNFIHIVKWLMKRGHIPQGMNFAEDIPKERKTTTTTRNRRLSDAEFLKLLEVAQRSHPRDYYLCLFMRFAGRRIGEVTGRTGREAHGMVWGDVKWDEDVIIWDNTKARAFGRTMKLTSRLRAILEAWKEVYCAQVGVDDVASNWFIFPALTAVGPTRAGYRRRRVISPQNRMTSTDRIIRDDLLKPAGLWQNDGDGWHILRKTFGDQRKRKADEMGRADALEMAQYSLDHQSPDTTRIYIDYDRERERYEAFAEAAEEMDYAAMLKIPALAPLAQDALAAQTARNEPATASADAQGAEKVYTIGDDVASVVDLSSRRRLRAVR